MNYTELDEYRIDTWELKKDLEKSTLKTYLYCLEYFCNIVGLSPDELVKEADLEQDQGIKVIERKINRYFITYKKRLEKEGKAEGTVRLHINALKSFYDAHEISPPKIKAPKGDISLEKNYGKLLKKEELRTLVNMAAPREKALIYLMALTGMAQAEARSLTLSFFMRMAGEAINKEIESVNQLFEYEKLLEKEIITVKITRKKVNYRYITFIPPEATKQIIYYLKDRVYGRNEKIRIKNVNGALFVKKNGEPVDQDIIVTNLRRIGLQAGFKKEPGAYSFWRAHGLRKYFISTIVNKTGDWDLANFLVGHKILDRDRAYWYIDTEELKEKYEDILPYISIDEISNELSKKELKRLEKMEKSMKDHMLKSEPIFRVLKENPEIMTQVKEKN